MINPGKKQYQSISVSDDQLLNAINKGIQKDKNKTNRRFISKMMVLAASMLIILFTAANISLFYSFASEIPILGAFVQAMRIGNGGTSNENLTTVIRSDEHTITFSFQKNGETINEVPKYAVSYHYAPSRIQMTIQGADEGFVDTLKQASSQVKGIKEVYQVHSLQNESITLVIQLDGIYNYELMELKNPGSLVLSFYQDAYYTEDERNPGEKVYFLSSNPLDYSNLQKMFEKYQNLQPTQIKISDGKYLLLIGEYNTKIEAEKSYDEIINKYGTTDFFVDDAKVENMPDGVSK